MPIGSLPSAEHSAPEMAPVVLSAAGTATTTTKTFGNNNSVLGGAHASSSADEVSSSPVSRSDRALRLYKEGKLDEAEVAFRSILAEGHPEEQEGVAVSRITLAHIARQRQHHERAFDLYLEAERKVSKKNGRAHLLEAQLWLGVTARNLGRSGEGEVRLERVIRDYTSEEIDSCVGRPRYHAAVSAFQMNKMDRALMHLRSIEEFEEEDYVVLKTILAGLGSWDLLAKAMRQCLEECEFSDDAFPKARVLVWLSQALILDGEEEEGKRFQMEAIDESSTQDVNGYLFEFRDEMDRNMGVMTKDAAVEAELKLYRSLFDPDGDDSIPRGAIQAVDECDWSGVDAALGVPESVRNLPLTIMPEECHRLPHLDVRDCLHVSRAVAEDDDDEARKVAKTLKHPVPSRDDMCRSYKTQGNRLLVGLFSAHYHPAHFMSPTLKVFLDHCKKSLDLDVIFFHQFASQEYLREAISVVEMVDVSKLTPTEVADQARRRKVHVWIEMSGYTGTDGAIGEHLFHDVAPVVVLWGGAALAGSMGTPRHVQYVLADEYSLPPTTAIHGYDEKPIRLPGSFVLAEPKEYCDVATTGVNRDGVRREVLPNEFDRSTIIYAYPGPLWKISRDDMDRWCRVLTHVPNSVLWLVRRNDHGNDNDNLPTHDKDKKKSGTGSDGADAGQCSSQTSCQTAAVAVSNIEEYWVNQCHLSKSRLRFTMAVAPVDQLAVLKAADVVLGTALYNNDGSASVQAMYSGIPLVHMAGGDKMVQRTEGSVLHAAGLAEDLIATSSFEYVQIAARLGTNRTAREGLSNRLRRHCHAPPPDLPLFNPLLGLSALKGGLDTAFRRFCRGESPVEIPLADAGKTSPGDAGVGGGRGITSLSGLFGRSNAVHGNAGNHNQLSPMFWVLILHLLVLGFPLIWSALKYVARYGGKRAAKAVAAVDGGWQVKKCKRVKSS